MTVQELLGAHIYGCLTMNSRSMPVGTRVVHGQENNELFRIKLNMSEIFRDVNLWNIKHEEKPIGMLYLAGDANERDFRKMLPLEDLDDAIGMVIIPGYKMVDRGRPLSQWEVINLLNLALNNLWSLKFQSNNHLVLWDNIFIILLGVCSGTNVKLPEDHCSECACYRMIPQILAVCEWVRLHPEAEASMASGHAQTVWSILDKIKNENNKGKNNKDESNTDANDKGANGTAENDTDGNDDIFSIGHLCPVLLSWLPILGIKSVHIEKDAIFYENSPDHFIDAKIETLSVEDGRSSTAELVLESLERVDDNDQLAWKYLENLKAPGWRISSRVFIELVNNLKQLKKIESVEVDIAWEPEEAVEEIESVEVDIAWEPEEAVAELFLNSRANSLLSKCVVLFRDSWAELADNQQLCDAVKEAKIEHLSVCDVSEMMREVVNYSDVFQNVETLCENGAFDRIELYSAYELSIKIPSLKRIECGELNVKYDSRLVDEQVDNFVREMPRSLVSERSLNIRYNSYTISDSILKLTWAISADRLYHLIIDGRAIESLHAPGSMPAFAGKFETLTISNFHRLSGDMCYHLGEIGGSVKNLFLNRTELPTTLVCEESEKLAMLLGAANNPTPLGRNVTNVYFDRGASESFDLELLLRCTKLVSLSLHLFHSTATQMSDAAISRITAGITKFGERENGPKVKLSLPRLNSEGLVKLLSKICPKSDPCKVIRSLSIYPFSESEFTPEVWGELKRYKFIKEEIFSEYESFHRWIRCSLPYLYFPPESI